MLLDANVLLRAIDGPRHPQYEQAKTWVDEALAAGETPRVHPITMMEVSYVLASKPAGYGWERIDIADALEAILEDPTLAVGDAPILARAVELYRQYPLDLQDCYLAAVGERRHEHIRSFDGDLERLSKSGCVRGGRGPSRAPAVPVADAGGIGKGTGGDPAPRPRTQPGAPSF